MTGKHGKPRPGHMTEKSIIERLLQDFCLLIDYKIKEGEDRKMERRKKDKGGFGARRRRKQRRAAAAKTPPLPHRYPQHHHHQHLQQVHLHQQSLQIIMMQCMLI